MKANELMIGDWVKVFDGFKRITQIRNVSNKKEFYSVWCDEWGMYESDLEPIPLTAEILEKNGFHHHLIAEKGFTREEWTLSDDYYDIVVSEWSDSIWVFRYECTEMNTPHEQRVFGYVHNLQHALRECGVDKEIVL